jgi:hypothetical protein
MVGNPFLLLLQGYSLRGIPSRVESVCQLDDIFYPWVEIFLLADGLEIPFLLLHRDTVYAAFPSRSGLPAGFILLPWGLFLLVDKFEILFFITQGYSLQHLHSSQSSLPADDIFYP